LASSDRLFFFTAGKNGDHLEYYRHDSKQPLRYKVAVTEAVKAVIFYSYNFYHHGSKQPLRYNGFSTWRLD